MLEFRRASNHSPVTLIRAGWIVAFEDECHHILKDGVLVYQGDRILHVGLDWQGPYDKAVDASGMLVAPGFISTHAHISNHAGDRLIVDSGRRDFQRSGFLNYLPPLEGRDTSFSSSDDAAASYRYGFASLLRNGITTVVEMGGGDGGSEFLSAAEESGIRFYYSPVFNGGDYVFSVEGRLKRRWKEDEGLDGLARAAAFIERHHGSFGGRLQGILVLDEAFNATEKLLHETKSAARDLGVGITLHFAEQVYEFHEILRRTGKTPLQFLEGAGFLGPEVILGHAVYVGGHSLASYPYGGDLELLAASGASVAHSPLALARRGVMLESFQRYLAHGINLTIGTDSYPQDFISEMRWASVTCKIADRNNEAAKARDVFNAATLGGAKALGRDDIGRLAPGAKSDIVLIDFSALRIGPVYDPIRSLIYAAHGDLVDTVIIDGEVRVSGGRLLPWEEGRVLNEMRAGVRHIWENFPEYHWAGNHVDDVFPQSLKPWQE